MHEGQAADTVHREWLENHRSAEAGNERQCGVEIVHPDRAFITAQAERLPLALTMPVDRRGLRVADAILADSAGAETLDALAAKSGGSMRTIQRIFLDETGMPLSEWRQVARLMEAAALLLDGKSVTDAALGAGYAGTSAFIHAFRRKFGQTPTAFRAGQPTS